MTPQSAAKVRRLRVDYALGRVSAQRAAVAVVAASADGQPSTLARAALIPPLAATIQAEWLRLVPILPRP